MPRRVASARPAEGQPPGAGERYGHLVVVDEGQPYYWRGKISRRRWRCECDCGRETTVRDDFLRRGHTRSCGCEVPRVGKVVHRRHGARADRICAPEYDAWRSMVSRSREGQFKVHRSWTSKDGYENFLRDIGPRPSPGHRLVRVRAKHLFGPGNAEWSTAVVRQGVPRHLVTYRGREMALREVAAATGLSYTALQKRLSRGWSISEVFKRPGTR